MTAILTQLLLVPRRPRARAWSWHAFRHIGQHRIYGAQWPTVAVCAGWVREHPPTPFWRRYLRVSAAVTVLLTFTSILS